MTKAQAKARDIALFSYGFRVFFLLAGFCAVASVGAWYLVTIHTVEIKRFVRMKWGQKGWVDAT